MKICPKCGTQNPDEAFSCTCGYTFENVERKKVKSSTAFDGTDAGLLILCFFVPFVLGSIFKITGGLIGWLIISYPLKVFKDRNGSIGLAILLTVLGWILGIVVGLATMN